MKTSFSTRQNPAGLTDLEREHFALSTAATYTTVAALVALIGGWLLMLLSALASVLFWPACGSFAAAGLLFWRLGWIWRRLRTLDAIFR